MFHALPPLVGGRGKPGAYDFSMSEYMMYVVHSLVKAPL